MAQQQALHPEPGSLWEVIGGATTNGILVREDRSIKSAELPQRLATGASVRELDLIGERLQFELVSGDGPARGWASIKLKEKTLCQRLPFSESSPSSPGTSEDPAGLARARVRGRKPRVLCLHGTACSEKIFRMQLGKLMPKAKKELDLVFLDGRKEVGAGPARDTMQKFFPGLPNLMYDSVHLDEKGWRAYEEPRVTLAWLQDQMRALAPIDAALGFSQGANFAVMLAAQANCALPGATPLGCAVLLCPNAPGYVDQLPELFEQPVSLPTLLVRGEHEKYSAGMEPAFDDFLAAGNITLDTRGEEVPAVHVQNLFCSAEMMAHPDGHIPLPSDRKAADEITERIVSFIVSAVC